jgi:hypothetical protein
MPKAREALPAFGDKTISNTLTALGVGMARSAILAALAESGRGIMKASDVRLDRLAQDADSIFQDGPAMARAGQYPPRGYLET